MEKRPSPIEASKYYLSWGIASIAVVWGLSALSGFAPPSVWAVVGLSAGLAVLTVDTLHRFKHTRTGQISLATLGAILALTTITLGFYQLTFAMQMSDVNDRRCRVIELEMLRGKPRRDDLADLFQAFRCRPQSTLMPRRPADS